MSRCIHLTDDELKLVILGLSSITDTDPVMGSERVRLKQVLSTRLEENLNQKAQAQDKAFITAASKKHSIDGEVEVDELAIVSPSHEGAYVMAWVWVTHEEARSAYSFNLIKTKY